MKDHTFSSCCAKNQCNCEESLFRSREGDATGREKELVLHTSEVMWIYCFSGHLSSGARHHLLVTGPLDTPSLVLFWPVAPVFSPDRLRDIVSILGYRVFNHESNGKSRTLDWWR